MSLSDQPERENRVEGRKFHATRLMPLTGEVAAINTFLENQHPASAGDSGEQVSIVPISALPLMPGTDPSPAPVNGHAGYLLDSSDPPAIVLSGLAFDEMSTWNMPAMRLDLAKAPTISTSGDEGEQGYVALLRKLAKSSGVYALASIATPLASLVLAPFLTHSLSHADYGALAILNTIVALAAGITQLGLSSAFFRAYNYDYDAREDRLGIFSTTVTLLALSSLAACGTVILLAPQFSVVVFGRPDFAIPIQIAALAVLAQNLTVPGFAWLRATGRAAIFSLLSIANLAVALGAALVLVGVLRMGIAGALLATGGGYAFVVFCTLPAILVRARLRFRADIARNLLSFGVPLVLHFVSYWVLQLSDRYLLSRLGSLAQVAGYAVAYSLGGVLSVVIISPFILAWPTAMFSIAKREDAAQAFRLVFRWFSLILLLAAFAFSFACTAMLDLLFPASYHSAAPIIPLITASIMFYGVYNVFATGVGVRRKTWLTAIFTTISALANVGLNLFLIPLYGAMGAAISTLVAYALLALISYLVNQRIYPIPFEVGTFAIALVFGVGLYIGCDALADAQGAVAACLLYIAASIFYAAFLLLLGKFPLRKFVSLISTGLQEVSAR